MEIIYNGPLNEIEVAGYGRHQRGKKKSYPAKFAKELLATSKRQKFAAVVKKDPAPPPKQAPKEKPVPKVEG